MKNDIDQASSLKKCDRKKIPISKTQNETVNVRKQNKCITKV